MPASFTTFAHFTVSEAMKRPNSSGLICAASPPSVSKRFFVRRRRGSPRALVQPLDDRARRAGRRDDAHQSGFVARYARLRNRRQSGQCGRRASRSHSSGFNALSGLWGSVAPAGTPRPVIERLHKELSVILASAETKKPSSRAGKRHR